VGKRYGVSRRIVDFVKDNDTGSLVAEGMNLRLVEDPAYRLRDRMRLATIRLSAALFAAVMGLVLSIPPAGAAPEARARRRARVRARGLRVAARRLKRVSIRLAKDGTSARAVRALRAGARRHQLRFLRLNGKLKSEGETNDNISTGDLIIIDPVE